MDENKRTIETYESDIDEYAKFVDEENRDYSLIYEGLSGLPNTIDIFEIGSGMGIEANKIEELGYTVQRSDATGSFRQYMANSGKPALDFNVLTDEFPSDYDVILANAVLLHFNRTDFQTILEKVYKSLRPNGRFLFSVQNGEGERWKENKGGPRYFCYWTPERLVEKLSESGFKINKISLEAEDKWIMVQAEKSHES